MCFEHQALLFVPGYKNSIFKYKKYKHPVHFCDERYFQKMCHNIILKGIHQRGTV